MKETAFTAKNEGNWKALEDFNNDLKNSGIKKLAKEEVREFTRLFRIASFNLAYAKTHFPSGNTVTYLNKLVGISHNFFYVRERGGFYEVKKYFLHTLPRTVRETYIYWVLATAFFMFGAMFAAFYVAGDTTRIEHFVPASFADNFTSGDAYNSGDGSFRNAIYMTNNTRVAFNSFAWGILFGVGSLFILFYNGLNIGSLFGYLHQENADMLLAYSYILPHGVLELSAIFLAGGCGLMLGKGILIPGDFTRRHSLILHAKEAAKIIPAIVIMLILAAFIEAFFSPLRISPWFKLAFALFTAIVTMAYFSKGGWNEDSTE